MDAHKAEIERVSNGWIVTKEMPGCLEVEVYTDVVLALQNVADHISAHYSCALSRPITVRIEGREEEHGAEFNQA